MVQERRNYVTPTEAELVRTSTRWFSDLLTQEGKGHKVISFPGWSGGVAICTHQFKGTHGEMDTPPRNEGSGMAIYLFGKNVALDEETGIKVMLSQRIPQIVVERISIPHGWEDIGIKIDTKQHASLTSFTRVELTVTPDDSYDNESPRNKQPKWLYATYVITDPSEASKLLARVREMIENAQS